MEIQKLKYIREIKRTNLWNNGYISQWDFSQANSCEEARIEAVTEIARVCRGDKPIANPAKLYQQLLVEHAGKPGEIFQFIPTAVTILQGRRSDFKHTIRFGYKAYKSGDHGLYLSNLRAMLEDSKDEYSNDIHGFYVFKIKVPLMIVPQILEHGQLSFNQQSEKHCKLREYYYCDELYPAIIDWNNTRHEQIKLYSDELWNSICYHFGQCQWDRIQKKDKIGQILTNKGSHSLVYTTLWIAGWKQDELQWDNFFAVRTKKPTQIELQTVAKTMQQMMEE